MRTTTAKAKKKVEALHFGEDEDLWTGRLLAACFGEEENKKGN